MTLPGVERSQVTPPGVPSPRPLVWLAPLLSGVSPPPAWLVPPPRAYGSPPAAASVAAPRPAAKDAHTHVRAMYTHNMSIVQGLNFTIKKPFVVMVLHKLILIVAKCILIAVYFNMFQFLPQSKLMT